METNKKLFQFFYKTKLSQSITRLSLEGSSGTLKGSGGKADRRCLGEGQSSKKYEDLGMSWEEVKRTAKKAVAKRIK